MVLSLSDDQATLLFGSRIRCFVGIATVSSFFFDISPENFCTFVDNLTEPAELDFLGLLSATSLN